MSGRKRGNREGEDDQQSERAEYVRSGECEVDFCERCYEKMEALFKGRDMDHINWVMRFITSCAHTLLVAPPAQRERFVWDLAYEWPTAIFERLVGAVVDVADIQKTIGFELAYHQVECRDVLVILVAVVLVDIQQYLLGIRQPVPGG